LNSNTTGAANTGIGYIALRNTTTGANNTGTGTNAMKYNTDGHDNTAVRRNALPNNTTGDSNVSIGSSSGKNLKTGSNNVHIANGGGTAAESQVMRLGSSQAQTYVAGITGVPRAGATVVVTASGQLGVVASSARYKDDIGDLGDESARLQQLWAVRYHYKADPTATQQYGLIAEEVAKVYPEIVVRGKDNRIESLQYHQLIPILLRQLQGQQQQIEELKAQNQRTNARNLAWAVSSQAGRERRNRCVADVRRRELRESNVSR
jgi:trimeric autotransporter adhesin